MNTEDLLEIVRDHAAEASALFEDNKNKGNPTSAFDAHAIGQLWGAKKALDTLLSRLEAAEFAAPHTQG